MGEGPAAIWQEVADHFDALHAAVTDDQWGAPTPCEGWTVRDLVDHAVNAQAGIGMAINAGTAPGDDWATVKSKVAAALADPANLAGEVPGGPFAGMPKHQAFGAGIGDLLIHSWDLATATGGDTTLPAAGVQATLMGLQRFPAAMLRSPGMFGPELPAPDGADDQQRLLAFVGRQG